MDPRPLTPRERAVLEALLSVEFDGVEDLRRQAVDAAVVETCGCGCPSIDFRRGRGMSIRVNAGMAGCDGGLFLYTITDPVRGELLGGIEWVDGEGMDRDRPAQLELFDIQPA